MEQKIYSFNMYNENDEKIYSDYMTKAQAKKLKERLNSNNETFEILKLDVSNNELTETFEI